MGREPHARFGERPGETGPAPCRALRLRPTEPPSSIVSDLCLFGVKGSGGPPRRSVELVGEVLDSRAGDPNLLVVIDQAEELITRTGEQE